MGSGAKTAGVLCAGLLLLHSAPPLPAAPKEAPLQERLLRPDMEKTSSFADKEFGKNAAFGAKTYSDTRAWSGGKKDAQMKRFETKDFLGIKIPWFSSKKAPTESFALGDRAFKTSESREAGETYATRGYADAAKSDRMDGRSYGVREAPFQGVSQTKIDAITRSSDRQLSVEEVRELLNKPGPLIKKD